MVKFRNLEVSPDDPVDQWGTEGLLIAIERGGADEWQRITRAARVAGKESALRSELDEALDLADGGGKASIRVVLGRVDETAEERVQRKIRQAFRMSRLNITEFAERVGTSRSRMSAYLSGKTMPSALIYEKMDSVAKSRRDEVMFS